VLSIGGDWGLGGRFAAKVKGTEKGGNEGSEMGKKRKRGKRKEKQPPPPKKKINSGLRH